MTEDQINAVLGTRTNNSSLAADHHHELSKSSTSSECHSQSEAVRFRILVFPLSPNVLVFYLLGPKLIFMSIPHIGLSANSRNSLGEGNVA